MTRFEVLKKSGFISIEPKVSIFDEYKKPFYDFRPLNNAFNLPEGIFFTNNTLRKISPINYKLPDLPKKKKRTELNESDFIIKFGNNSNKASIYLDKGIILIDSNYYDSLNEAKKTFLICHELGHIYYNEEKNADLFAVDKLLRMGYNPSQLANIAFSTFDLKNEKSIKRCESIINNIQ